MAAGDGGFPKHGGRPCGGPQDPGYRVDPGIALSCRCTWFDEDCSGLALCALGASLWLDRERGTVFCTLTMRRNWPQLTRTVQECGVTVDVPREAIRGTFAAEPLVDFAASQSSSLQTVPRILMKGIELAGDRPRTRYPRLIKTASRLVMCAEFDLKTFDWIWISGARQVRHR